MNWHRAHLITARIGGAGAAVGAGQVFRWNDTEPIRDKRIYGVVLLNSGDIRLTPGLFNVSDAEVSLTFFSGAEVVHGDVPRIAVTTQRGGRYPIWEPVVVDWDRSFARVNVAKGVVGEEYLALVVIYSENEDGPC